MYQLNCAGWVIPRSKNSSDFVTFNEDTADRAERRPTYQPVSKHALDLDKKTLTTDSGEKFKITGERFSRNGYTLERMES